MNRFYANHGRVWLPLSAWGTLTNPKLLSGRLGLRGRLYNDPSGSIAYHWADGPAAGAMVWNGSRPWCAEICNQTLQDCAVSVAGTSSGRWQENDSSDCSRCNDICLDTNDVDCTGIGCRSTQECMSCIQTTDYYESRCAAACGGISGGYAVNQPYVSTQRKALAVRV